MVEDPIHIRYRGYDVYKCNTWTQGPVMLQGLRLLEKSDLKSMGFLSSDYVHVVTEAMKLAYADRDKYYGDPAFVSVPLTALLSDQYTDLRWPLIDMKKASKEIRPGDPIKMSALAGPGQYLPGEKGTTTCVVVDKWGNIVAATPSANPEYGVCESLGVAHNTRLSSLNIQKGHPNALAAGKRPRITLTPTIVLKDGSPFLGISVQGGDLQDQVALQLMLDVVEFGMKPVEAIASPRFKISHLEDSFNPSADPMKRMGNTGTLDADTLGMATIADLEQRGHIVKRISPPIANPVMVFVDASTGMAYAAGEPKPELESKGKGKYCAAVD